MPVGEWGWGGGRVVRVGPTKIEGEKEKGHMQGGVLGKERRGFDPISCILCMCALLQERGGAGYTR